MKLVTQEDIAAPQDKVWAVLSDIDGIEREAVRRGVRLRRLDSAAEPSWEVEFSFRERRRQAQARLTRLLSPELLQFEASGMAAEAGVRMELVALSPNSCRLTVTTEFRARTLAARLLLQSLKLARGRVNTRYQQRIGALVRELAVRAQA